MRKAMIFASIFLIAVFTGSRSYAQTQNTITFDELLGFASNSLDFSTQDFWFESNTPTSLWAYYEIFNDDTYCDPPCPTNGTPYLYNFGEIMDQNSYGSMKLTHTSNLFSFESFDIAVKGYDYSASQIDVVGNYNDGSTVQTSFTGFGLSFETFYLPSSFTDLASVNIISSGGIKRNDYGIDNLILSVSDTEATPVVPEPVSSTLFIVGGVTLGLRRFMRRKLI